MAGEGITMTKLSKAQITEETLKPFMEAHRELLSKIEAGISTRQAPTIPARMVKDFRDSNISLAKALEAING